MKMRVGRKRSGELLFFILSFLILSALAFSCYPTRQEPRGSPGILLHNGIIYIGLEGKIKALNSEDGHLVGSYPSGKEKIGALYHAPIAQGEVIYFGTFETVRRGSEGRVYSLKIEEGEMKLRWVYPPLKAEPRGAFVGVPLIWEDKLIAASSDGRIYAIDMEMGGLEWRYPEEGNLGKIWSSPALGRNERLYFGSADRHLYAFDLEKKEIAWKWKTGGAIFSTPLVVGNTIYVGSFDGNLYALEDLGERCELLWKFPTGGWIWTTPAIYRGKLYFGSFDRKVYEVDVQSGRGRALFSAEAPVLAPPLIIDGILLLGAEKGNVYGWDLERGDFAWEKFNLGGSIRAPFVREGDKVFVVAGKSIWAFDGRTGGGKKKIR